MKALKILIILIILAIANIAAAMILLSGYEEPYLTPIFYILYGIFAALTLNVGYYSLKLLIRY